MYAATDGPNVKWGGTDFKWGSWHHCLLAGDGPVCGSKSSPAVDVCNITYSLNM